MWVIIWLMVTSFAEEFPQIVPERFIHERVYDGVGYVVGEIHIEDDRVARNEAEHHEEGGEERDEEDDGDDEQHRRRPHVRHAQTVPRHLAQALLARRAVVGGGGGGGGDGSGSDVLPVDVDEAHLARLRMLGGRVGDGSLDDVEAATLLALSLTTPAAHRTVDDDVEHDDDAEAGGEEARVELLVVHLELGRHDVRVVATVDAHVRVVGARVRPHQHARGAVDQRDDDAHHAHDDGEERDDDLRAEDVHRLHERPADAEVAVERDGDHDEGGEGDVGCDEEVVEAARCVAAHVVVDVLHDHRVGDDDRRHHHVDDGQRQDEGGGDEAVGALREDVEDDGVAGDAEEREEGEDDHDGVHLPDALLSARQQGVHLRQVVTHRGGGPAP